MMSWALEELQLELLIPVEEQLDSSPMLLLLLLLLGYSNAYDTCEITGLIKTLVVLSPRGHHPWVLACNLLKQKFDFHGNEHGHGPIFFLFLYKIFN